MKNPNRFQKLTKRYQSGVMTTFTGILILVMLTLMMFFAIRVGVFEQRVSSSEMRQKLAFHAAESGIHSAKELLRKEIVLVASPINNVKPDGSDGWLSADGLRWKPCADAPETELNDDPVADRHPCYAEAGEDGGVARRDTMFYYVNDTDAAETEETLRFPVDAGGILPGTAEEVDVFALLCVLELDEEATASETPVKGCVTDLVDPDPADSLIRDGTYFMVTLLSRGRSDCDGAETPTCGAEALISEQVSNFGAGAGGKSPAVPLTTRSTFPPSGSAEVVPNPNAGGIGVPISVWMPEDLSCDGDPSLIDPSSGSWATCEMHEWYGTDVMPDDYACPGNCSCAREESISYTHASDDILGIDLVTDSDFPCDLFQFYFAVPRTSYEIVKGYSQLLSDCDSLGPNSSGIYWVSGPECRVNSNTQVGSPGAPVMLISAAGLTRFNGGAKIYGTLFITDVEDADAELQSNGTNTIYGSAIVDGTLGSYQGTFQVVWNDNVSRKAGANGGLGSVIGGWSDIHREWTFKDSGEG